MGRTKENPRYNVLSCRVDDDTARSVKDSLGFRSVQQYIHDAIKEKLKRERVMISPDLYGC